MAGGTIDAQSAAALRRKDIAGKSGWAGLAQNRRVFAIAIFASLGGLLYGYNQGVFSGILVMNNFDNAMGSAVTNTSKKGYLVSVLQLGAWAGVLAIGYLADKISRKYTIFTAVIVFCVGVIVQTSAKDSPAIYGGRFVTGLGVGSFSAIIPIYIAELAPPEIRGSLGALQLLTNTFGVMISFWITYGTNYIGGTGATQSQAAWKIPIAVQLVPAVILGIGILFMPFSPRWLVNQGRDDEALEVLCRTRNLPRDNDLIQIEFLEIKASHIFEQEVRAARFPQYQDGSAWSKFMLGFFDYLSLITTRSLLYRTAVATLLMFFQQWTGINAILYYAPTIFGSLGLTGNTTSLLATGVIGVVMFIATIPAVMYIDKVGRKPILVSGAFLMATCHLLVAILSSQFQHSWSNHVAAGWAACTLVWVFTFSFGYSWCPTAWVVVAEIWPLPMRAKGMSIGASSNWMNNFIVGQVTPIMLQHLTYGTFIYFGLFSFLGGIFVLFFVPETKSLTLEEMDVLFGSAGLSAAENARHAEIANKVGLTAFINRTPVDETVDRDSNDHDIEKQGEHLASNDKDKLAHDVNNLVK